MAVAMGVVVHFFGLTVYMPDPAIPQVKAMGSIPKKCQKNISPEFLSPIEMTKGEILGYMFLWWPLVGHGHPDHFSLVV